ncbi:MAG: CHAP domain-containing protein [Nocardioides sp.]
MLPARPSRALLGVALGLVALVGTTLPAAPPSHAATIHCVGYDACAGGGFGNGGYAAANQRSYWNMVTGHNCTNYVAFRLIQRGGPASRPWDGSGDAHRWGYELPGSTDMTPIVGSVAWWDSFAGGWGENGHVAMVEKVLSADTIQISEDIFGGDFRWRTISRGEAAWPTGFIHLADERVRSIGRAPRISGTPRVGETLTAGAGTWDPEAVAVSYQWRADGRPVRGATRSTLTLAPGLLGDALTVEVTAKRIGYLPASVLTERTNPVRPGRIERVREPRIRGRALVGEVLIADPGRTRPDAKAAYRWLADGRALRGATSARLKLTPSLAGSRISVRVTLRRPAYEALTVAVRLPGKVARAKLRRESAPQIVGSPRAGSTLSVVAATWSAQPSRRAYVWFADDQVVEGVYGPRLQLGPEHVGRTIVVVEGASKPGYSPGVAVSDPVGPVTG